MTSRELAQILLDSPKDQVASVVAMRRSELDPSVVDELKARADEWEMAEPARALDAAEIAASVADALDDPAALAASYWARANALRQLGEYESSLDDARIAHSTLRRLGQHVSAARVQVGQVDALMYLGRYDEALSTARQARRVFVKHGLTLQAAKIDANVGNIHLRLDDYPRALSLYTRARKAFQEGGERLFVAHVDVNRANVLTDLNRFDEALDAYLDARQAFDGAGMPATVAMIDANIGYLYHNHGKYRQALERLLAAREEFETHGLEKNAAVVALDLTNLYVDLNLYDEASNLCDLARMKFKALSMRSEEAHSLIAQAAVDLYEEDYPRVKALLMAARRLFAEEGNEVWQAVADLELASVALRAGDPGFSGEALRLCRNARAVFVSHGLIARLAYSDVVEAHLLESTGDTSGAKNRYLSALKCADRLGLRDLTYRCHHGLARLVKPTRPATALARLRQAVSDVEQVRGNLGAERFQMSYLADKLGVYEDLVDLSLERGGSTGLRIAFDYVERAKSRALVDMLARGLDATPRRREHERYSRQLKTIRSELDWYYNRISTCDEGDAERNVRLLEATGEAIRKREQELTSLIDRMEERDLEYASLNWPDGYGIESAQQLLQPDQVLLEYFTVGDEVMVFAITSERMICRRRISTVRGLAALHDKLRFQLGKFRYGPTYVTPHLAQLREATTLHLQGLYERLVRPVEKHIAGKRLIVVPHGLMHYLPFHAFFDGNQFLIDKHEVWYSPSSSVLRFCLEKRTHHNGNALVMAVPDDGVPTVAAEAQAIASIFPNAKMFVGADASDEALRAHGPDAGFIHIASHAVFSPTNPMFSRLKLGNTWLNVHDVYNLKLSPSLVTLSACETGVNKVVGGDELIGLARGFFYAGSPSLVVSLWSVNDESTAKLMTRFYSKLRAGASKGSALREAQLETREEYDHPYYWSPFVLLGAG